MFTHASHLGWGAVYGLKEAAGHWNRRMSLEHSNYRELLTVLMALKSFGPSKRKEYSNSIRQCDHSGIYQSSWRSQLRSDRYSKGYLERGIRASDLYFCKTPSRPAELPCRHVIKTVPPIRVAAASQSVSSSRSNLGPTHNRSFCNNEYHPTTIVQQQISRPFQFRYRCLSSTRLEYEQQFYNCSLQAHSKDLEHYQA